MVKGCEGHGIRMTVLAKAISNLPDQLIGESLVSGYLLAVSMEAEKSPSLEATIRQRLMTTPQTENI
jgi:hypothetical protein